MTLVLATRAELVKLTRLPSTWVALVIGLALPPLVAAGNGAAVAHALRTGDTGMLASTSTVDAGLTETLLVVLAAVIIGVVAVSSEHTPNHDGSGGGRQVSTSILAVPRRGVLLVAKALAVALVVALLAAPAVVAAVAVARLTLGAYASDPPGPMRIVGAVLYVVLFALLALALTVLTRRGYAPLVILLANASVVSFSWLLTKVTDAAVWLPDLAGSAMFLRERLDGPPRPSALAGGLAMAAWVAVVLAVAGVVHRRRDA